jgi:hypothetical protein
VLPVIDKWLQEIARTPSSNETVYRGVMLHAAKALIYSSSLKTTELSSQEEPRDIIDAFLTSTAYVVSWHAKALKFSKGSATMEKMRRLIHEAFICIDEIRPVVLKWVEAAASSESHEKKQEINQILKRVQSAALSGDTHTTDIGDSDNCVDWKPTASHRIECQVEYESAHPYPPLLDQYELVTFPGVQYIAIYFDERTSTEKGSDWLSFFKDTTCTDFWGEKMKMSGGIGNWPGVNGRPPLIVPADKFYLHVHTDAGGEDWGYKFKAIAPISEKVTKTLLEKHKATDESIEGLALATTVVQLALKECMHDEQRADKMLKNEGLTRLKRLATGMKQGSQEAFNQGTFIGPNDDVLVNLQTSEVTLNASKALPTPNECTSCESFQQVFGWEHLPYCNIRGNYEHCRRFQLVHENKIQEHAQSQLYLIEIWDRLTRTELAYDDGDEDAPDLRSLDEMPVVGYPKKKKVLIFMMFIACFDVCCSLAGWRHHNTRTLRANILSIRKAR